MRGWLRHRTSVSSDSVLRGRHRSAIDHGVARDARDIRDSAMTAVIPATATVAATERATSNISHLVLRYWWKIVLYRRKRLRSFVVGDTGDAVSFRLLALRTRGRGETRDGEIGPMTGNYTDAACTGGFVSDGGTLAASVTESVCRASLPSRRRRPQSSCRFRVSRRNPLRPS